MPPRLTISRGPKKPALSPTEKFRAPAPAASPLPTIPSAPAPMLPTRLATALPSVMTPPSPPMYVPPPLIPTMAAPSLSSVVSPTPTPMPAPPAASPTPTNVLPSPDMSTPPPMYPTNGGSDSGYGGADQGPVTADDFADDSVMTDDSNDNGDVTTDDFADDNDDQGATMDGFDTLGTILGADAGYSLPALWAKMNAMKPMSKANADLILKNAVEASQAAADGLSGAEATKAKTQANLLRNTRVAVSNMEDDPISEGVASGVRQMVAQGFTYGNELAEINQAEFERLSQLFYDINQNAGIPGAPLVKAARAAGAAVADVAQKVWSGVQAVGSTVKYIVIGGVVIVVGTAGVFVYRSVKS